LWLDVRLLIEDPVDPGEDAENNYSCGAEDHEPGEKTVNDKTVPH
jgi:hypothetical protein